MCCHSIPASWVLSAVPASEGDCGPTTGCTQTSGTTSAVTSTISGSNANCCIGPGSATLGACWKLVLVVLVQGVWWCARVAVLDQVDVPA